MKLSFTIFTAVFIQQLAFSQSDTFSINKSQFVTRIKTKENTVDSKDTLLLLYRVENGNEKYLLTHYLYARDADCNNSFTELGTMTIKNDSIIFLKHYLQTKKNRDPIPEWKKQIYKVTASGKLILVYNKSKKRYANWVESNYNDDHKDY